MSHTDNMIIDEANAKDLFDTAADDLLQDETNPPLTDMTNVELVEQLILAKAQQQHFTELEKKIKDELLNRSDFTKMDYQGIVVDVRQTKRVSFTKGADMKALRAKYPNIIKRTEILNPNGIAENVLNYIKEKNPDAFVEQFDGDAKLVDQIEPGKFTTQSVSTAVYVTGMGKAL